MEFQQILDDLSLLRTRFGRSLTRKKKTLLRHAAECSIRPASLLLTYHELLLFICAYPDDAELHGFANSELERVREAAGLLCERSERNARQLEDSGIANTAMEASLSFEAVRSLVGQFPADIDFVLEDGSLGKAADELLDLTVSAVERYSLFSNRLSVGEWFEFVRGDFAGTALSWFITQLTELSSHGELPEYLLDSANFDVRWRLCSPSASRTFQRFPTRRIYSQKTALRRKAESRQELTRRLPQPKKLSAAAAKELIRLAQNAVFVRQRETDPFTHANHKEVLLFSMERGVDVALFGMKPSKRRSVESYFGYLAAKNGVPLAYGGGWIFFKRAEIGIHVFDTFRGGESADIFQQILRVYRSYFNVERFVVDPYQFGADNKEGISSGAFWFYFRLGFRPCEAELCVLANSEWRKMRNRSYRSSAAILRRLTEAPLELHTANRAKDEVETAKLNDISLGVVKLIAEQFDGNRRDAERWAVKKVSRALSVRGRSSWPKEEQEAFKRLSVLFAAIPELTEWQARERQSLLAIMRAKGKSREAEYVRRFQDHPRLPAALAEIAAKGIECFE